MKLLLLDVDGVLVTGRPADGLPWTFGLMADLGINPEALVQHFFAPRWEGIVTGRADLHAGLKAALEDMECPVPPEQLVAYWFAMDSRVDPDVLEACEGLRQSGWLVWLATNQDHNRAAYLMGQIGLSRHVDGMVYSAQLGLRKPQEGFYTQALARIGGEPERVVLVDDTADNLAPARRAGIEALHWTPNARLVPLIGAVSG